MSASGAASTSVPIVTEVDAGSFTGATTSVSLKSSVLYRLLVIGTYTANVETSPGQKTPQPADTKCTNGAPTPTRQLRVFAKSKAIPTNWKPYVVATAAGCDKWSAYYLDYMGTDEPLTFVAGAPQDNVGKLTVYIYPANGLCASVPAPEWWYGTDLFGQTAFADPRPATHQITYGDGQTRTVTTGETVVTGCNSGNHSFSNALYACNSRYDVPDPDGAGRLDRANMFVGEMSSATWIVDSYTDIAHVQPPAFPQYWWQNTGHGGLRSCNIEVPTDATGKPVTYTLTARGNYQWEAPTRPSELADAMCSTPSGTAIVFDPALGGVYIADQGLDTVSAMLSSGEVVRDPFRASPVNHPEALPLYPSARALAVNPNTGLLYVGEEGDPWYFADSSGKVFYAGGVRVINPATGNVVKSVNLGVPVNARYHNLTAIAVNATTNKVYAANGLLGTVSVIDGDPASTTFNKVLTRLSPTGRPTPWFDVAVDEGLGNVYVVEYKSRRLYVIDAASDAIVRTIPLNGYPGAVEVDPQSHTVYVTNVNGGSLFVIDPESGQVNTIPGVGTEPLGVGVLLAEGTHPTRVYVASRGRLPTAGQLTVIDPATRTVIGRVPSPFGGPDPEDVAVDQAQRRVYVANSTSHTVSVFDGNSDPNASAVSVVPVAAITDATGKVQPQSHWKAERNPYYGETSWRNVGYYQSLWVDSLTRPGQNTGGAVTDLERTPHWVPVHPDTSGECADPVKDPDHTYKLTWTPPYPGPIKLWIYGYYYYENESFGQLSVTLQRNP